MYTTKCAKNMVVNFKLIPGFMEFEERNTDVPEWESSHKGQDKGLSHSTSRPQNL